MPHLHNTFKEVYYDLRSFPWVRLTFWLLVISWTLGLLAALIVLGLISHIVPVRMTACTPDSAFQLSPTAYSYWGKSSFFQVTLGFGHLTFSEAKIIDVIWDVFVGRGGQAILAYVSWQVFAFYVSTSMEVKPITYGTFRTMFLQDGPSVITTFSLLRDFTFYQSLSSKICMTFLIVTAIYILMFPTMASAMTGYSSSVDAFVRDASGSYVPFREFKRPAYMIHDGERIGKSNDFIVEAIYTDGHYDPIVTGLDNVDICRYSHDHVEANGFYGIKKTSTHFMRIRLDSPILNITAFYTNDDRLYARKWQDTTGQHPFNDPSKTSWIASQQTYNISYISENGKCQATEDYQWGFSFVQLFIMVTMILFWTIGIYLVWLRSHNISSKRGTKYTCGGYKAMFNLTAAMKSELANDGIDLQTLSEKEIMVRIQEARRGSFSFPSPILYVAIDSRAGFMHWLDKEAWWLFTMFVPCSLALPLYLNPKVQTNYLPTLWWSLGPTFALVLAMVVGSTRKSRCAIACILGGLLLIPSIMATVSGSRTVK